MLVQEKLCRYGYRRCADKLREDASVICYVDLSFMVLFKSESELCPCSWCGEHVQGDRHVPDGLRGTENM